MNSTAVEDLCQEIGKLATGQETDWAAVVASGMSVIVTVAHLVLRTRHANAQDETLNSQQQLLSTIMGYVTPPNSSVDTVTRTEGE